MDRVRSGGPPKLLPNLSPQRHPRKQLAERLILQQRRRLQTGLLPKRGRTRLVQNLRVQRREQLVQLPRCDAERGSRPMADDTLLRPVPANVRLAHSSGLDSIVWLPLPQFTSRHLSLANQRPRTNMPPETGREVVKAPLQCQQSTRLCCFRKQRWSALGLCTSNWEFELTWRCLHRLSKWAELWVSWREVYARAAVAKCRFFLARADFGRMFDKSFPACAFLFLFFKWRLGRVHLFHSLGQGQSTAAQRIETTAAECSLTSCVWARFLIGSLNMPAQRQNQLTPTSLGQGCMHI